jgi:Na+/proline symporter
LSFFFVFSMGSLGQPQAVHKYYMLRDPLQLKWYPLLKTLGLVLVLLLYFSVGVGVKAFVLGGRLLPLASPDQATPSLLLNVTPIILAALVFSGVAAATMSAANSFINIGAAIVSHDLPIAFGRTVRNELGWGRAVTVLIAIAAAITAQRSGTMVAFLGIFGWGLFASTLVPALAVGLNWQGATRAGAIASIATGLVVTLALETAAYRKAFTFPAGVTASAVAMVASFLVFFLVSWLTRRRAPLELDSDVQLVMEL